MPGMLRRLACVIVSALLMSCAPSAPKYPTPPPALTHTGQYLGVKGSVEFLASDELEGRGIGTEGLEKAAAYINQCFSQFFLQETFIPAVVNATAPPNYYQAFQYKHVVGTDAACTLVGPGQSGEVNVTFRPLSFSGDGVFDAPVVFAGFGASRPQQHYDDYADVDVKGKVALVLRYEPLDKNKRSIFTRIDQWSDSTDLAVKARIAQERGAVALLVTEPVPRQLITFRRSAQDVRIPVLSITQELANEWLRRGAVRDVEALRNQIESDGRPASAELADVRVQGNIKLVRRTDWLRNVIGVLPGKGYGTDKGEYIVVGAHYDHLGYGQAKQKQIHNGADDNASGTAALLELARRFSERRFKQKESLPRTIVFIAFSGEESGVLGSNYYVHHPALPLDRTVAMVNFDMVGRMSGSQVLIAGRRTAPGFKDIIQQADDASPVTVKISGEGGLGPSDHFSFAAKKVPVLFLWTGLHGDYHQVSDDADKVNYAGLNQVVDFGEKLIDRLLVMPKQKYDDSADKVDPHTGGDGMPMRVTLGVIPDPASYSGENTIIGVRIVGSRADTPAAKAGLVEGDVVIKLGDRHIESIYGLTAALSSAEPDKPTTITIMRNGEKLELPVTLTKR
jgi:hypothetical protein